MSKQVIIRSGGNGEELSKEQKKFNSLIKKIRLLKEQIALLRDEIPWFKGQIEVIIRPSFEELMQARRDILLAAHQSPAKAKLTRTEKTGLAQIIKQWAYDLLRGEDDTEMIELFNAYAGQSIEEHEESQRTAQVAEIKRFASAMGVDLDISPEDIREGNPEILFQKLNEAREAYEQNLPPRKPRKKTAKQLEKEQKLAEAEKKLSQTTKKVYFDLVRNFHPDQEQDPEIREKKNIIMQEINAAYNADDFLKLLDLQLTLLDNESFTNRSVSDEDLKYFNILLKQQVDALTEEMAEIYPDPREVPLIGCYSLGDKAFTIKILKQRATAIRRDAKKFRKNIPDLATPVGLKAFVMHFSVIYL